MPRLHHRLIFYTDVHLSRQEHQSLSRVQCGSGVLRPAICPERLLWCRRGRLKPGCVYVPRPLPSPAAFVLEAQFSGSSSGFHRALFAAVRSLSSRQVSSAPMPSSTHASRQSSLSAHMALPVLSRLASLTDCNSVQP